MFARWKLFWEIPNVNCCSTNSLMALLLLKYLVFFINLESYLFYLDKIGDFVMNDFVRNENTLIYLVQVKHTSVYHSVKYIANYL